MSKDDIQSDLRLAAEFRAACDDQGVPYDVAGFIRHHRGNAALGAEFTAMADEVMRWRKLQRDLDCARLVEKFGVTNRAASWLAGQPLLEEET